MSTHGLSSFLLCDLPFPRLKVPSDGTGTLSRIIGPVKSRFNSRPRGMPVVSDLIGHRVDHAHYPSRVPHVIASAADLLTLVQP